MNLIKTLLFLICSSILVSTIGCTNSKPSPINTASGYSSSNHSSSGISSILSQSSHSVTQSSLLSTGYQNSNMPSENSSESAYSSTKSDYISISSSADNGISSFSLSDDFSDRIIHYPFPQGVKYPFGIKPTSKIQAIMNQDVLTIFDKWIDKWVTSDGCPAEGYRVTIGNINSFDSKPYSTFSEGIGWGMLITVYMDSLTTNTKKYFDGFNKYRKAHLQPNGLMYWRINPDQTLNSTGPALEADENMALALVMADYQWGSDSSNNYFQDAQNLISSLMVYGTDQKESIHPNYSYMKPYDSWGGHDLLHLCNFDPAYYRVWRNFTGDTKWLDIIDGSYSVIQYFYNTYNTGLLPHFSQFDGSPTNNTDPYFADYTYEYDSSQTPFKIGLDYLWNGSNTNILAFNNSNKISNWLKDKTGSDASLIRNGYQLDGTEIGKKPRACFVGGFGIAAMASSNHQQWLNNIYEWLRNDSSSNYYDDLIRLPTMLCMTGNMPNFMSIE